MSSIQYKIIRHSKNHRKYQENVTHNEEKNYCIEKDPEMWVIVELVDKNLKTCIINFLHLFKDLKENLNIMKREMEALRTEWNF